MPAYRMYFWMSGWIHGSEDFEAADDVAAIRIDRVLYLHARSDICEDFDLWQGKRQLRAREPHHQIASPDHLIEAHQNVVIEITSVRAAA